MNWNNLLKKCCPKCEYRLSESPQLHPMYPGVKTERMVCENPDCGFRIGKARFDELVDEIKLKLAESGDGDVMCSECRVSAAIAGSDLCERCNEAAGSII